MSESAPSGDRETFTMIGDSFVDAPDVPMASRWLLIVLKRLTRRSEGRWVGKVDDLARLASMSKSTALRATPPLEERGYVRVSRNKRGSRNDVNEYRLLRVSVSDRHRNDVTRDPASVSERHRSRRQNDTGVGVKMTPPIETETRDSVSFIDESLNNRENEAARTVVDSARHDVDDSARAFADDDADAAASQASTVDLAALIAELKFLREAVHGETVTPEQIASWQRMSRSQIEAGIRLAKGSAA
ncbi:hypothetical protein [Agromyces indicus]|uniref:Helix-turn-helix domain-containing protein n=1 Tax=Agromyces indicus TaxID=758919 RepID=A0ABU1FI20_9MICO|nr:hypothetical protein [Agromyces indicus]MDR5691061.1 hypothetical protein [Agromyces indicus]